MDVHFLTLQTHVHLSTAQQAWNCFRSRGPGIHSSCTYVPGYAYHGIPAVVTHQPETEIVRAGRRRFASSGFRVADKQALIAAQLLAIDHINPHDGTSATCLP